MPIPDYSVADVCFSVKDIFEIVLEETERYRDDNGEIDEEASVAIGVYETLDYIAQHLHERGDTETADLITFLTYGSLDD